MGVDDGARRRIFIRSLCPLQKKALSNALFNNDVHQLAPESSTKKLHCNGNSNGSAQTIRIPVDAILLVQPQNPNANSYWPRVPRVSTKNGADRSSIFRVIV